MEAAKNLNYDQINRPFQELPPEYRDFGIFHVFCEMGFDVAGLRDKVGRMTENGTVIVHDGKAELEVPRDEFLRRCAEMEGAVNSYDQFDPEVRSGRFIGWVKMRRQQEAAETIPIWTDPQEGG